MNAILRAAAVLVLVTIGILAVCGLTPPVPQSVIIAGFFGGGALLLLHWGARHRTS